MKNTFGQSLGVTVFGESHATAIGAVLDGLAPGIEVDEALIARQLDRRRGLSTVSTKRREKDEFKIVSGYFEGKTTGTPLCIIIENEDTRSKDYSLTKDLARPGHADYTAYMKYHGFQDYRGGGHFSGRITTPLVAAGAIAMKALNQKGIFLGTHILLCAGVRDRDFGDYRADFPILSDNIISMLDDEKRQQATEKMKDAAKDGDSVGGVLQTAIVGLPAGVGEPWFDSFESIMSHALFSVPAVKGVEFGAGFGFADMRGSEANDCFAMNGEKIETVTNHNGGINGGITNGMPVLFNCVVKPTASIYKKQNTVDFIKKENAELQIKGRHDPAIIGRAAVVVDSVTALTLYDMLALRFGTDYFKG